MEDRKVIVIMTHGGGSPYHGPNMRVYFLAKTLVDLGHKVYMISCAYFHKYYNLPKTEGGLTYENIDGIEYIWVKSPRYKSKSLIRLVNQLYFASSLYFRVKGLKIERPDYIIASSPPPFVSFPGKRMAKHFGAKLIFEIRDLWPLGVIEFGGMHKWHPYIKLLDIVERYSYKVSDMIVSVKPGDLTDIQKRFNLDEDKLKFIPNGFDVNNVHIAELEDNNLSNKLKGKFVVGYAGALTVAYAIDILISAAKQLQESMPNLQIVLVGSGSDHEAFEKRIQEENITNIIMTGFVEKKYILSYLKYFDVCYIGLKPTRASKHGISSNKLFDYMFNGNAVLAAYNTDHDPVTLAGAGMCVEPSVEGVKAGIEQFYEMGNEKIKALGRNAKSYLLKHHTFDKITSDYLDCFEELDRKDKI